MVQKIADEGVGNSMNYASVVFAGFATISLIWYFVRGRKAFTGPPVPQDVDPSEVGVVKGQAVIGRDVEKSPNELEATKAGEEPKMAM